MEAERDPVTSNRPLRHLDRYAVDTVVAVAEPVPFGMLRLAATREIERPCAHSVHARPIGLEARANVEL